MIETKRTYLRAFKASDFSKLCEMESDIEVMKHTGPARVFSTDESRVRLHKIINTPKSDYGIWAACNKVDDELIGWFMLTIFSVSLISQLLN